MSNISPLDSIELYSDAACRTLGNYPEAAARSYRFIPDSPTIAAVLGKSIYGALPVELAICSIPVAIIPQTEGVSNFRLNDPESVRRVCEKVNIITRTRKLPFYQARVGAPLRRFMGLAADTCGAFVGGELLPSIAEVVSLFGVYALRSTICQRGTTGPVFGTYPLEIMNEAIGAKLSIMNNYFTNPLECGNELLEIINNLRMMNPTNSLFFSNDLSDTPLDCWRVYKQKTNCLMIDHTRLPFIDFAKLLATVTSPNHGPCVKLLRMLTEHSKKPTAIIDEICNVGLTSAYFAVASLPKFNHPAWINFRDVIFSKSKNIDLSSEFIDFETWTDFFAGKAGVATPDSPFATIVIGKAGDSKCEDINEQLNVVLSRILFVKFLVMASLWGKQVNFYNGDEAFGALKLAAAMNILA